MICRCGKSQIFSNSVRNKQNLLDFFVGKCDRHRGFCSDLFCGKCLKEYIQPLENGVTPPPSLHAIQKADRYGCPVCKENQNILIFGDKKDPEGTPERLMNWYKRHLDDLKKAT